MERAPRTGRGEYWHRLVVLFFLGWVLIYANRAVLSPLLSVLQGRWGMSKSQLGLLNSAFFLTYTLMQVPTGLLADRFGRRLLLLPGYFVHGLGAMAGGLAPGPGSFLLSRVVTGFGQSTYYATQYALASAAVPARFRALGMAIINSGMAFGIAVGMLAASASLSWGGGSWRAPFLALGLATLAFAAVLSRFVRPDPPAGRTRPAPRESAPTAGSGSMPPAPSPAPAPARRGPVAFPRNVLLAYVVALATMYGFFVILTWLPYYLETQRGLAGARSGLVSTIVAFAAVPAGILAGRISDRTGRRRPALLVLIPLSSLALALIVWAPGLGGVYAAIALYGITGKLVVDPLIVALVADATPRESYAAAFGVLNFAGTISTVLAPALTGYIADLTGTFHTAFLLAALLQVLAGLCVALMRPEAGFGAAARREEGGDAAT